MRKNKTQSARGNTQNLTPGKKPSKRKLYRLRASVAPEDAVLLDDWLESFGTPYARSKALGRLLGEAVRGRK